MTEDFPTRCQPLPKGSPPISEDRAQALLASIPHWRLSGDALRLVRRLDHFQAALDWIAQVGAIAETHDHHPDIHLTNWNRVELVLTTHSIKGLSDNDFVVARAIDQLISP